MLVLLCILATFNAQLLTAGDALGAQQKDKLQNIMKQRPEVNLNRQRQDINLNDRVKVLANVSPWYKIGSEGGISVIATTSEQLDMFQWRFRGDGSSYIRHRYSVGKTWSNWQDLGGNTGLPIKAASLGDGRMAVFAVWLDKTLRCRYYDGGSWSEWQNLGGSFTGAPEVVVMDLQLNVRDRIDVTNTPKVSQKLAAGQAPQQGQSPSAQPLSPNNSKMGAILKQDSYRAQARQQPEPQPQGQKIIPFDTKKSRIEVYEPIKNVPKLEPPSRTRIAHIFVKNIDGTLWHRQGRGPSGSWNAWQSLGGTPFNSVVATASTDKKIDVVIWNNNTAPSYGAFYWDMSSYKWSGWMGLNIAAGAAPVIISTQEDQLEVFCLSGADTNLYHRRRTGTSWSGWVIADNRAYPLAAMSIRSGIVQLFVQKADFELYEIEWDGRKFLKSKIGGYCAQVTGVRSLDKPRFDLFLDDGHGALWQKWWGPGATLLPETGLQPHSYPSGGQGQPANAFGECNAGLRGVYKGQGYVCEPIPPPPPPTTPPPPPPTTTPPPSSAQKPVISVAVANATFVVTGSGLTPNSTVTVRVADDALTSRYFNYTSTSDGRLQAVVPNICVNAGRIYFSATDGRRDASDRTGSLWSNTVPMSCTQ